MILSNRQSIRLKGYNYSSNGAYFVTICTEKREVLFGDIADGKMVLNEIGKIAESVWESLPQHHPVELDQFQIMPNHVHGIIIINQSVGAGYSRPVTNRPTLGNIIAYFKYQSTKRINNIVGVGSSDPKTIGREDHAPTEFRKIFQRNYFEHIIRNNTEMEKISQYILNNPQVWDRDRNNPNYKI